MNLLNSVSGNMKYIQKVFLGVQVYMEENHDLEALITFLNAEPPGFRSVAYESASMEMALPELLSGRPLDNWKKFYQYAAKVHTFHMHIGLGWAFAKTEIVPKPYLESLQPLMSLMVFDGMGYYHGLFKGRKTVKNHWVPEGIGQKELQGFDQGLGRRLWYISKGEVNELVQLIQPFPLPRHADLWRGVGIACGYVGGSGKANLEQLLDLSAECKDELCTGVALTAVSRSASNSVSEDINVACNIICRKPLIDVVSDESLTKQFYSELEIII